MHVRAYVWLTLVTIPPVVNYGTWVLTVCLVNNKSIRCLKWPDVAAGRTEADMSSCWKQVMGAEMGALTHTQDAQRAAVGMITAQFNYFCRLILENDYCFRGQRTFQLSCLCVYVSFMPLLSGKARLSSIMTLMNHRKIIKSRLMWMNLILYAL